MEHWAGDETFPPNSIMATLRTPLQLTRISCKSSRNVCLQVFLGRPLGRPLRRLLFLLPPLAGLSDDGRSICKAF